MSEPKTPESQETKPAREIDEQTQKHIDRLLQGKEVWNKWANEMLARKEELEKAGKWNVKEAIDDQQRYRRLSSDPSNLEVQTWLDKTYVDFSYLEFVIAQNLSKSELEENQSNKNTCKNSVFINSNIIDFSEFIFPDQVVFASVRFKGEVDFRGAVFKYWVGFDRSIFQDGANFKGAKFSTWTSFFRTKFKSYSNFDKVLFRGEVAFFSTVFKNTAMFKKTMFDCKSGFMGTKFKGRANFSKATFKGEANFSSVRFKRVTDFTEVKFIHDAEFKKTLFNSEIKFSKAKFRSGVSFTEAKFNGKAYFYKTHFKSGAIFFDVKFNNYVSFSYVECNGIIAFIGATFEGFTVLFNSRFTDEITFEAIKVKRAFNLEGAEFISEVPDFNQASFIESPRLDNIKVIPAPNLQRSPFSWQRYFWTENYLPYLKRLANRYCLQHPKYIWNKFTNNRRNPDEEAHYRALKRLAIQAHDHENEMKFFAGEIRSRRHITDCLIPWKKGIASSARYWAGVFYEAFSDFGRSFIRPIAYWGITFFIFANLTLSNAGLQDTTKCHNSQFTPKEAATTIGLKNSLLILGLTKTNIVKQAELCLYGANKNGDAEGEPKPYDPKIKRAFQSKPTKTENTKTDIPFKAAVQGIAHSLLSLLFIFLLLLAIRNQFKIK